MLDRAESLFVADGKLKDEKRVLELMVQPHRLPVRVDRSPAFAVEAKV